VVVEYDSVRVDELKTSGFSVLYGDAEKALILKAAGIDKAKLLLITTPVTITSKAIVAEARRLNSGIHIMARAHGIEEMQILHDEGVSHLVQPEFEAGLEFARQALIHIGIPADQIEQYTDGVREELYGPLYSSEEADVDWHRREK